jgi:DegV family protein with EDD domain
MTIRIVTDSTCDLPNEEAIKYGIRVIPIFVNMNGKSYQDGVDLSRKQFYEELPRLKVLPTTSVPGVEAVKSVYQDLVSHGATGIISLHIASNLSNMYNVARLAAKKVKTVPIEVVDTGQLTLGLGLLCIRASQAVAEGKSIDEIVTIIKDMASRTWSFALLATLDYIHRGGRLPRVHYEIGRLLNVKPVLIMHENMMKLERAFTYHGSISRVMEIVNKLKPIEQIAMVHANFREKLDTMKIALTNTLQTRFTPIIGEVTPAIGVHTGPGGIGLVVVTKETANLER